MRVTLSLKETFYRKEDPPKRGHQQHGISRPDDFLTSGINIAAACLKTCSNSKHRFRHFERQLWLTTTQGLLPFLWGMVECEHDSCSCNRRIRPSIAVLQTSIAANLLVSDLTSRSAFLSFSATPSRLLPLPIQPSMILTHKTCNLMLI